MIRVVNRVLAALLAAALLCIAIVTVFEVVFAAFDRDHWVADHQSWTESLRSTSWDASSVRFTGFFVALSGLALLLAQLKRRPAVALAVRGADDHLQANVMRVDLAESCDRLLHELEGVESARVRLSAKNLKATVRSPRQDRDELKQRCVSALQSRFEELQLIQKPSIKVVVRKSAD